MKNKRKYKFFIISLMALFSGACTENPGLDIRLPDALIVVDGWIENGQQAKVFLTTNSPYFTSIDSSSIRDLVLSQAKVSLSDGETSEVLILRKDARYFPPFYYEGNTIFGETGKTYTLTADYGGKSIVSHTTIPPAVEIDSVYFAALEDADTLGLAGISFTDPPAEKNYYRIFFRRLSKDDKFISSFIMAIDDQFFNGKNLNFTFAQSPESFLSSSGNDYFQLGDTILIKLCTMDEASFNFWNTYQDEVLNATNPFASSMIDLESNIEGDGLGVWGGYGVSIDTIFTLDRQEE